MVDLASAFVIPAASFVVGTALGASNKYLTKRTSEALAEHRTKKHGDHVAINSRYTMTLDHHSATRLKVGAAAAPSVSFEKPTSMNPERIDRWRTKLPVAALLPRDYLNPDELIRYRSDDSTTDSQLIFAPSGLIEFVQPVEHDMDDDADPSLDIASVVGALVPFVVLISEGAHSTLYSDQMRTQRLDWRISVSRQIQYAHHVYGPSPAETWRSITFSGTAPESSTPHQQAPMNGDGLASELLRNIRADTPPADIILPAVESLIRRAGYTSIEVTMSELRSRVDSEIADFLRSRQSEGGSS